MAILYYVNVANPNQINTLPPALREGTYNTKLGAMLFSSPNFGNKLGSYVQLFDDQAALTAYANEITPTEAEQAEIDAWKTANSITITYHVFELSSAGGITVPTPFGN